MALCDPMKYSTPGLPVLHYIPELPQTHVHWVGDDIQPMLSPYFSDFNLSQHQGFFPMSQLFALGGQTIGTSASVLPMDIQCWYPLRLTGLIYLLSRDSQGIFSSTTIRNYPLLGTQTSLWSNSLIGTWLLEKQYLWLYEPLSAKW